ncbi:MAG: hypothetical protein JSS83_28360 [Cyanobacteria bacterium SZAS LIN-3]|nr:hypothetical protein [Cyanobacteria bacterium SZAS LIN-3]
MAKPFTASIKLTVLGLLLLLAPAARAGEEEEFTRFTDMAVRVCGQSPDKAVRERTASETAILITSRNLEKTNSINSAIKYLQAENLKSPSALLCLTIGRLQERQDNEEAALAAFGQAIKIGESDKRQLPFSTMAQEIRANRLAETEQFDRAIADSSAIIERSQHFQAHGPDYWHPLAHFYEFQQLRSRVLRGHIYQAAKNYTRALAEADALIKNYGGMSDGYQMRARALQSLGRQNEAVASMKEAIARGANARLLADIQLSSGSGSYEKSYQALSQAMQTSKDKHALLLQRAVLSSKNNHPQSALADYQTLVKL